MHSDLDDGVADVKVAMHFFFEDGEFVKDDLYDKFVIHVMFTQKMLLRQWGVYGTVIEIFGTVTKTIIVTLMGPCRSICISLS